jgi:hypothetical protein
MTNLSDGNVNKNREYVSRIHEDPKGTIEMINDKLHELSVDVSQNQMNDTISEINFNITDAAIDNYNFIPPFFYSELGGHLGWKSGSPDTILEGGHPRINSAKFG